MPETDKSVYSKIEPRTREQVQDVISHWTANDMMMRLGPSLKVQIGKQLLDTLQQLADRDAEIAGLVDALKKVRRAFATKYNAREIAIIDAVIGPADPDEELAVIDAAIAARQPPKEKA